jgi:excisionase family DNA binding protein
MSSTLLNTTEAAEVLRLGVATLHRWRKAGKGPVFVEMGRKVYYRRADLDRWVDGQRRQPQSQADAVTTRNSP